MEEGTGSFGGIDREYFQVIGLPNMTGTPERRLLLAILERAILDYVGNDVKEVEEAEVWLFGDLDSPRNAQFSFPWICEQLDLDTYRIAAKIRSMPRRGNRKVAPWYFSKSIVNG
jgi:hypothetical protein